MQTKRVRGVKDILPEVAKKIQYIEYTCQSLSEKFGFKKIILPIIENFQLYQHSLGFTSDIVEKQMFIIQNKSQEEKETFVLRPEGTAGMVRAFVENNFKNRYYLKRFFYFGPMFRYERPQKGRYREFYQFGLEIFEEPPGSGDVVLVSLINKILKELSIDFILEVNTIGCPECRGKILDVVKNELNKVKDILCDSCKIKLEKNPLRILDCKTDIVKIDKDILEKINIQNHICKRCKKEFEVVINLFEILSISYKIEPKIVRGLDYYNGFVFEYKCYKLEGAQNTICAGGRYDFLISQFDRQTNFACGAALGIDRILDVISEEFRNNETKIKVGIGIVEDKYIGKSFEMLDIISKNFEDVVVIGPFGNRSLKSQLRLFNNENCRYVIIIGDEIKENKIIIKDFEKNKQEILKIEDLKNYLI
ncbi:MAG: histidine--tRNA ligase [Elusimicrobiota bacterium]|nr:histidine--tRNA ligase [Endomicrobiia bacterium]MDW8165381.1 histidine--tRNA ligase [Elusimicrobiota bacterium]